MTQPQLPGQIIAWISIYEHALRNSKTVNKWSGHRRATSPYRDRPRRNYYTVSKHKQNLHCSCGDVVRFEDAQHMQVCAHIRALIEGKVVEKPLPKLPQNTYIPPGLIGVPHATLSKVGDDLLRWRWAAAALRSS